MDVAVTRLFAETINAPTTVVVHRGGARSSKSYSIAQYIIWRITRENNGLILITRKTMPALRLTAQKLIISLLKEYVLWEYCTYNKTHNQIIYNPTNSIIQFLSIDNPERLKSTEWSCIWMEEATEFSYNDYQILKTRLSAKTNLDNKLILSFNPTNAFHWIKTDLIDKEEVTEIVSNFEDNPYLPNEYIMELKKLKDIDTNYWRIYGEGEWGSLEHVIFNNWTIVATTPVPDKTICGLDFGYTNPTALVEVKFRNDKPNDIWITEILYKQGMTNEDLIKYIKNSRHKDNIIYADSAEPQRIEEMRRAGLDVRPANKSISVKDGIDIMKRYKLHISKKSPNLIKEIRSYCYKEKNGIITEEPVPINNHAIDAARYAIVTYVGKPRLVPDIVVV